MLARDGGAVLRTAVVLRQRDQQRASQLLAVVAAAVQLFEAGGDAVQVGAHGLHLAVELVALRRLAAAEQEEAAAAVAAETLALHGQPVELLLLARLRLLVAADLLGAAGVLRAAVQSGKLRLQALAGGAAGALLLVAAAGRGELLRRCLHGGQGDGQAEPDRQCCAQTNHDIPCRTGAAPRPRGALCSAQVVHRHSARRQSCVALGRDAPGCVASGAARLRAEIHEDSQDDEAGAEKQQ